MPREAIREMRGGYRMALRPADDPLERQLYQDRTYEAGTLALMDRVLRPGDTMVDVGANLGLMTLHASRLVGPAGTVFALEPHPAIHERLRENLALNSCGNVRALEVAAGRSRSESTIYDVPSVNIGRSSLIRPSADHVPVATVKVVPLDEILAEQPVHFLKLDVEGFEADVLRGASETLRRRPVICMEVTAEVDHDGDPLAAHDIVMATGLYGCFRFARGKGRASDLVEVPGREALEDQIHDNVVYLPSK